MAKWFCQLGYGQWWTVLFFFRALGVAVYFLTGWVVWRGCRFLRVPRPERVLYLFLWNPLVLMMCVVQGHNDLGMALFTALAVYFAVSGKPLAVMPMLVLATLVKHFSGMLFPLAFLFVGRRYGWTKAALSTVLGLLLGIVISWPYVGDLRHFQFSGQMKNAGELHNSPVAMLFFPFEVGVKAFPWLDLGGQWFLTTCRLLFLTGFAMLYFGLAWRRCRGRSYEGRDFLRDAVLLHFVLVCLVSSKFYCWYLGMFFPLALWLPAGDWLRRAVLAITCAQLLSLTFIDQAHFLNVLVMLVMPLVWVLSRRPIAVTDDSRHTRVIRGGWLFSVGITSPTTAASGKPAS